MKTTNEKILAAALFLFAEKGYAETTMRDLANMVGVVPAAIYRHYPGKYEVYQAVLIEMEKHEKRFWDRVKVPSGSPETNPEGYRNLSLGDVEDFIRDMLHFWTSEPFPSAFRRMLTCRQYTSNEMSKAYQHYFGTGPVVYLSQLLTGANVRNADEKALRLWSQVLLLMILHDASDAHRAMRTRLDRMITETIRQA